MAALGLIMSAITAQAANIQITSLPFTIGAPGTYVITGNLSFTAPTPPNASTYYTAISVPTNLPGPVILDLKGFTLTSNGANVAASIGVGIGGNFAGPFVPNAFPITVRNGILNSFAVGIDALQAYPGSVSPTPLTNIQITNMTCSLLQAPVANSNGIIFGGVHSSTIKNCTFNNCTFGTEDLSSAGGNQYTDLTFNNVDEALVISPNGTSTVLDDCRFAAPRN
jgi:hypothetical protein